MTLSLVAGAESLPGQTAQAPDDGNALFIDASSTSRAAPPHDPTRSRERYVTLRHSVMGSEVEPVARLQLNLFPDASYTAVLDRTESNLYGGYTWFGVLEGVPNSHVILVIHENQVTGTVALLSDIYEVTPLSDGVHSIYEINPAGFPPEAEPLAPPEPETEWLVPDYLDETDLDDGSIIDVAVFFTPAARGGEGSLVNIRNRIHLAVAQTNQSYINSQVNHRIRMVIADEVAYTESGNSQTDLDRIIAQGDGFLDAVHSVRNTYGADLVMLIVETTENGNCGRGSIIKGNNPEAGFSIVERSCATGNLSFPHELGHNMGAAHDRFVAETNEGAYSYSHGYVNTEDSWRTVMAYNDACGDNTCTRIPYWSNPNVEYLSAPTGIASDKSNSADNRLTLNNRALTVSRFRESIVRDVYVNWTATNTPEDGTQTRPFNTVREGVQAVFPGRTVMIAPGSYEGNMLTIDRHMTLKAYLGGVTIGD